MLRDVIEGSGEWELIYEPRRFAKIGDVVSDGVHLGCVTRRVSAGKDGWVYDIHWFSRPCGCDGCAAAGTTKTNWSSSLYHMVKTESGDENDN